MKTVSAKATFTQNAEKLFGSKEAARETARQVLLTRSSASKCMFTVLGHTLRTDRKLKAK